MTVLHGAALAQSALPDLAVTPGATNPEVTQENIGATICVPGWTRTVRPPLDYTEAIRRRLVHESAYPDHRLAHYELDHLVPLSLGGAPSDVRNLWIEPRQPQDGWSADRKDELEAALSRAVCAGRVSLVEAQQAIARDWIAAYRRYVNGVE